MSPTVNHTTTAGEWYAHFNSDLSGDVTIVGPGETLDVPAELLVRVIAYVRSSTLIAQIENMDHWDLVIYK